MTQDAVVTKLISRHVAEVEVERGTACGGTCESCEACVFQNRIRAEAVNKISALPGRRSSSRARRRMCSARQCCCIWCRLCCCFWGMPSAARSAGPRADVS